MRQYGDRSFMRIGRVRSKMPDDVLVAKLREISEIEGRVTSGYLQANHPSVESALQNRGRRRIFALAGIELSVRGRSAELNGQKER